MVRRKRLFWNWIFPLYLWNLPGCINCLQLITRSKNRFILIGLLDIEISVVTNDAQGAAWHCFSNKVYTLVHTNHRAHISSRHFVQALLSDAKAHKTVFLTVTMIGKIHSLQEIISNFLKTLLCLRCVWTTFFSHQLDLFFGEWAG